jgi:hypothetical protein
MVGRASTLFYLQILKLQKELRKKYENKEKTLLTLEYTISGDH